MSASPDRDVPQRFDAAFRRLPRIQRRIFVAHCREGLSYEEIAAMTGRSVAAVERHLAKAICKLAKQMEGRPLRWWERWF